MDNRKEISPGLLELYVAGALPEDEMKEITALVQASPELQQEVEQLEASFLSYASLLSPPISEDTRQSITDIGKDPNVVAREDMATKPEARQVPMRSNRWWRIAAGILLAASVLFNIRQYLQLRQAQQQIIALEESEDRLVDDLDALQANFNQTNEQFADIRQSNTQKITLGGQEIVPDAAATVFWNPDQTTVYVDASQLPEPPEGKVYQLWWLSSLDPLTPHDAGLLEQFATNESKLFSPNRSVGEAVAFAITLEPAGGSTSPTLEQLYVLGTI